MISALLATALLAVDGGEGLVTAPEQLASPNHRLELTLDVDGCGTPHYALRFDDELIIEPSPLGLKSSRGDLNSNLELVGISRTSENSTWQTVWGQQAEVVDRYNGMRATYATSIPDVRLHIDFRLYDDGLGLRYTIEGEGDMAILDECTHYDMAGDYEAHWIAGSYDDDEYAYMHTSLSGITLDNMALSSSGNRKLSYPSVNTPIAMVTPRGTHIALHEAALWEYPAMSLRYDAATHRFCSDLAAVADVKSEVSLPFATPWRTIIVGERAGVLAESTLTLNLNEPCRLEDTSWIRPMKYVGVWWEMHLKCSTWDMDGAAPHCATTENVMRYIDFAAENGFGGVLVEGWNYGWGRNERFNYSQPYPDFDIDRLTAYAAERGVVLIGHHETYANVENYEEQMAEAYAYYESKGVGSVKTGYVGVIPGRLHNSREMVDHYNSTVVEAAKHRLGVDIHEPVHSTGICRTYPNLLSAEGMRGQEWQAWNSGNSIDHNPTLPFTRNVAGPMDFTPGIFDLRYHNTVNRGAESLNGEVNPNYDYTYYVNSTLAHQLALYVVFYSPIQMVADLPENYMEHPEALEFLRVVPVDWAVSMIPDAKIGDYAVAVRRDRHSEDWYVGGITDGDARSVDVSFDFLPSGVRYEATLYRDAEGAGWDTNPTAYVVERMVIDASMTICVDMATGGGFAMRLTPLAE